MGVCGVLKALRITTTEVNIARTHNYGVKMRQAAKARFFVEMGRVGLGWVNAGMDKTYTWRITPHSKWLVKGVTSHL